MMRIPTSLRVALIAASLALASNLTIVGFLYWRTHDDTVAVHRQRVAEEASALVDVYETGGRNGLEGAIRDSLAAGDSQLVAAILAKPPRPSLGNVLAFPAPPGRLRSGYQEGALRIAGADAPVESSYVLRPLGRGDWLLSGRSFGERLSLQRTLERSLAIALAASVLLGLLCGALIARYVSRRVGAIARVAEDITRGELGHRVRVTGSGDAFDALGQQINHMLDRIEALMEELRLLTDSLAHDLRSPVGRLRARIDAALRAPDEERQQQLLAGVLNEADSLMRILTTVLEIGRSEAMTSRKQFAWLGPADLVVELADMYEPLAEEAGASLAVRMNGVLLPMFGHRQLLAQALSNLVDNALKYGSSGREIVLVAEQDDGEVRLGVADHGPGIAAGDEAEARRRFGRLDASRSSAGAGLGLALAQAVAHLHRGRLELQDNEPGLCAMLVIPTAVAA